ncbi:hypothetical protein P691DRAFT_707263 [Macrolepiota fuliginosa MF-IS2]|uniref:Uncharacterized protein n=1 Tax=Macrolepiota fuliginosa MF-IS2 TaxID=1400762 RepID=A0A9P5XCP7_9AGAR|nr:hypothetical protein P691DRAFT_707263 [Macrolepiota fuliginosa MF-IS2]
MPAHQVTVMRPPYRGVLPREVTKGLKLLEKSMNARFHKLIVDSFMDRKFCQSLALDSSMIQTNAEAKANRQKLSALFTSPWSTPKVPLVWGIVSFLEPRPTATFFQLSIARLYPILQRHRTLPP